MAKKKSGAPKAGGVKNIPAGGKRMPAAGGPSSNSGGGKKGK